MREVRVAHLVLSLRPGGLEKIVCQLAEASAARNIPTIVCCLDDRGEFAADLEAQGVRVTVLGRRGGLDLGLAFRLARFLRRERIDVLHTHSLDPMFYGVLAACLADVRIRIHTQHNTFASGYGWRDRLKLRLAGRLATMVVAVSKETDADIARSGVPAKRRTVILNGVDDTAFADDRAGEPSGVGPTLGTVARLAPEKGLPVLLEAFRRVLDAHPTARLVIAGDGPARAQLEADIDRLALRGSVELLGHQRDVASVLRRLDVFVLPSLSEGIPLALLEAMAAGVPVVATTVGGVPEVVTDGVSGLLVEPNDAGRLADAVQRLIADPARAASIAEHGRARVRDAFSFQAMDGAYRWMYVQDPPSRTWVAIAKRVLRLLPSRLMIWRARTTRAQVALTFDDGPDPAYTPRILDVLAKHDVKATFFVIGERARRQQELVRRIAAEGHEIANHSYSHAELAKLDLAGAVAEIATAEAVVAPMRRQPSRLFRPPEGGLSFATLLAAWWHRMTVAMWTIDLRDYRADLPGQIERQLAHEPIVRGDIVLYHGNSDAALAALPSILQSVRRRGFSMVPVSQMLEA